MTPRVPRWQTPFCRIRDTEDPFSSLREKALHKFGHCVECGEACDGSHSFGTAPVLCDRCCPYCRHDRGERTAA
jgi:hypothetical protein